LQTFITSYTLFVIGFAFYFWLLYSRKKVEAYLQEKVGFNKANIFYVGLEKFAGFVLMLLLPLIVLQLMGLYDAVALGISFTNPQKVFAAWGIFGAFVLTVNIIRAGKPKNYMIYPHIRTQTWSISLLAYYILGWAIYLLGYEFLFRGVLFFSGIDILPLWLNIAINCILYAVAHLPKGRLEIIASLPFGVVLCLVSYYTGNFWAAWLIHLTLALSNSLIAINANPLMQVDFKKI
jgi:membrane protease YdiL (CAAX protease family)